MASSYPNPVLPVLTTRTRHYGKAFRHPSITIRQRYTPYPSRSDSLPSSPLSPTFPGSFKTLVNQILPIVPTNLTSLQPRTHTQDIPNTISQSDKELKHVVENDGLIPKPVGEAGRRVGGRGYNIEDALKWPEKDTESMKKYVQNLSEQHLNLSESFKSQNNHALLAIVDAALDKYPRLKQYNNAWPVNDVIKMYLKNTSSKRRRAEGRMGPTRRRKTAQF